MNCLSFTLFLTDLSSDNDLIHSSEYLVSNMFLKGKCLKTSCRKGHLPLWGWPPLSPYYVGHHTTDSTLPSNNLTYKCVPTDCFYHVYMENGIRLCYTIALNKYVCIQKNLYPPIPPIPPSPLLYPPCLSLSLSLSLSVCVCVKRAHFFYVYLNCVMDISLKKVETLYDVYTY